MEREKAARWSVAKQNSSQLLGVVQVTGTTVVVQ